MLRPSNTAGQHFLRRLVSVTFGLGLLGVASLAQSMDLWVGVGAGTTKFDSTRLNSGITSGSEDDSDTGWKLMFGGPMFEYFALEFSILHLGHFTASGTVGGLPASESIKSQGWAVEGIGMLPLGKSVALMARGGLFRNDVDSGPCTVGTSDCTGNSSVADMTYGVGVQYGMTGGLNLRAEWQRFEGLGDATSAEGNIDMLSISALYWF